jgi:predicted nucleic acid-binding protein
VIYLDSSALTKLVRTEAESSVLQQYVEARPHDLVTCELALTELPRAITRANHDDQRRLRVRRAVLAAELAAAQDLLTRVSLVALDGELLQRAGAFDADPHLGSLDAIHLVAAGELMPSLTGFFTYDKRLLAAATAVGLPGAAPD